MSVPTSRPVFERLEMVETGRRRRWTEDEKLRIVAESLSGARQGSSTARRHGISRSLLMTWRRQFRAQPAPGMEAGSGFVPALVVPESLSLLKKPSELARGVKLAAMIAFLILFIHVVISPLRAGVATGSADGEGRQSQLPAAPAT